MSFLSGYIWLMQKIPGVTLIAEVKIDSSAAAGSICGHICNAYAFITSYITCIFTGCVGSNEASIWPGSIGEINYFHCISWRLDLITYIHTATQLVQLGWVTSNAIEYLLEKQFNLQIHSPSYWILPRILHSESRNAYFSGNPVLKWITEQYRLLVQCHKPLYYPEHILWPQGHFTKWKYSNNTLLPCGDKWKTAALFATGNRAPHVK